jgi:hypothetical protein
MHVCVRVYMYMYTYIYMYMYMYMCMYMCMYMYMYVCKSEVSNNYVLPSPFMHTYPLYAGAFCVKVSCMQDSIPPVYACEYFPPLMHCGAICMYCYTCTPICMCVYIYVYVCMYIYIYIYICIHTHTHIDTRVPLFFYVDAHAIHTHTHTHTHTHGCTRTSILPCRRTRHISLPLSKSKQAS